ncbi:MAG TPA: sigma-70 family RNA polymerase sigma factor [Flavobacterium sp.]|uniref:RNA polymerase sigma factor n=1 Tax=unclassified Flavobacterium TaxID=196869 RepID=UPI0025C2214F|nr:MULTISPECIES: sigma-70 family RNA polymerase sigma factor [unclassified Flavobacterium]HRE76814.1 sigma-70 family RNA polymerase sigma factor [Flavobacterium sp.]
MSNESNPLSDKIIITKILNGDIQAFAVIIKNTEKLVTQIVQKLTANEEHQKDIVQEVYLKTYQNLSSFQFKSKLSTWIANIAYNTSINYLKKKSIPTTDMEAIDKNKVRILENPELLSIKNETVLILTKEIDKLPPLYKTLITLYHLEELSNKEIAEITKLPEGTIKSYLSRARKILKNRINHHYKIFSYGRKTFN